jgi:hypothetical protein
MTDDKQNLCEVKFKCRSYGMNDCAYFMKQNENRRCRFEGNHSNCTSKMATVNAMNLKIKEMVSK